MDSALTPYIAMDDARAALGWYAEHLGGEQVGEPVVMPDGRVGHAEMRLSGRGSSCPTPTRSSRSWRPTLQASR